MKRLTPFIPMFSIFTLALLVRIVYNVTVARNYTPIFDAAVYNNLAEELLKWHCYCLFNKHQPTTFRSPLWPFILAAIYALTGEHNLYPRLFYCVLGSGTCVLIYLLTRTLFQRRIALVTGIVAALYPGLFIWDGWLYSESLFTFCLTALLYACVRLQQSIQWGLSVGQPNQISWRWPISGGLFLGLALLTRPTGTILVGMLGLWAALLIFTKALPWQPVLKSVLAMIVLAMAINLPWMYRNYTVTHSITPISTIGTTLRGAYNDIELHGDQPHGMWYGPAAAINPDFQPYTIADEHQDTAAALAWIHNHLNVMPKLLLLHVLHLWTPTMRSFGLPQEEHPHLLGSRLVKALIPLTTLPLFIGAVLGLLVTWPSKRHQLLMSYLVITLTTLQCMVFYGSPRFRAPIEPLIVLLAGGALWWLLENEAGTFRHWWTNKRRLQPTPEASATEKVDEPWPQKEIFRQIGESCDTSQLH